MSTLYPVVFTLGELKTKLLRPVGKQNNDDAKAEAADIIQSMLDQFNTRKDWKFMRGISTYNVTTDGLLTLNTTTSPNIKKIYSVAIPGVRPLKYIPRRDFDLQNPAGLSVGGTYYYTAFTLGQLNQIEVLDHPSDNTSIAVAYQLLASIPATDNATFSELPQPLGNWLFCEGRARVIGSLGGDPDAMRFWMSQSDKAWADIQTFDSTYHLDHITQFMPPEAIPENFDPTYAEWSTY